MDETGRARRGGNSRCNVRRGRLTSTTFDSVAKRAGVSRSTVYRRWRTREDLLIAALQWVRTRGETGVEDWTARSHAEVRSIFSSLTVRALTDRHSMDLLRQVTALPDHSAIREAYWSAVVQPAAAGRLRNPVSAAREHGELPPDPIPTCFKTSWQEHRHRVLVNPVSPISKREAEDYTRSPEAWASSFRPSQPHHPKRADGDVR